MIIRLLKKLILKSRIETKFLLEQKWGLVKPSDPYSIPKYLLKKYLPENPEIVDCGAHTGADSVELAKLFPRGRVHSFEPVPYLFAQLKQNTRKYKNIHCYQIALSYADGPASMFVSSGDSDASSSLLEPSGHRIEHPDVLFDKKIHVSCLRLDSWALQNKVQQIDFLWLDMQGLEQQMLASAENMLKGVRVIHTEISIRESYAGSVLYPAFSEWLQVNGFMEVYKSMPDGSDMGNILFVNRES